MKKVCSLRIKGYEDRRELVAILASNGYLSEIIEEKDGYDTTYIVEVWIK